MAFALTTANSGLIDDRVNSLLFDEELGELWIGTLNGLSRLRVQTGDGEEGTSVQVYPNPLRLGSRGNLLTLTGLPLGAEVSIYTNSGQLECRKLRACPVWAVQLGTVLIMRVS